ncbi:urease subunit gamma [Streptomyces camelliae]|uniref:Urease subunit gamma n=1 Tax=Streptomyces camelliae TaxID=3004093 RepID=A0ABY7PCZ8_9ACTN|nr:urease subunit gamma [Streptomyces sp. HUAS 2-6]WBO68466.1 urease subunit gamma [Streptomyces sp. HUAS 2-6]
MNVVPREIDRPHVHVVADQARRRRARGTGLTYGEAAAVLTEAVPEAAPQRTARLPRAVP